MDEELMINPRFIASIHQLSFQAYQLMLHIIAETVHIRPESLPFLSFQMGFIEILKGADLLKQMPVCLHISKFPAIAAFGGDKTHKFMNT